MRSFIIYIIRIVLPVLFLILVINTIITPEYIHRCDYMDHIILQARNGYNAIVANVDMDERLLKKKYLELYKNKNIDYLVLGSSRLMPVSSEAVNSDNVLNLAIPGAKVEDLIAIYQASVDNNIRANHVLLGIDPLFFNSNYGGDWWITIAKYYYKFEGLNYDGGDYYVRNRLLSIDYFKQAISAFQERMEKTPSICYASSYINKGYTRRIDGAIYYPQDYREKDIKDVEIIARDFDISEYEFDHLSGERIHKMEKLIDSILFHGSMITVICCPYHPIMYHRISKNKVIGQTFEYVAELSKKKKISYIGSYNPTLINIDKSDFYDATHLRKETLDTLISCGLFHSMR